MTALVSRFPRIAGSVGLRCGAALALVLLLPPLRAARGVEQLADGIAAQVGSELVLVSEVLEMTASMEGELRAQGGGQAELTRLRLEGLERMIEWRLIEQIVSQRELFADDAEVDRAIEAIASENGLSTEELEANVVSHGVTYSDYRAQLKREIERGKVMGMMVSSRVEVEEADVEALYTERFSEQPDGGEQLHLRQILKLFGGDTGSTQEETCNSVREARGLILAGEPFQEVARVDNAIAADRGGDLGWVHAGSLAGWMTKIVAEMKPGELSEVTVLPFGCSLLELVARREYQFITLEMARASLTRELYGIEEAEFYREYMEKLREGTYIKRHGRFGGSSRFAPQTHDTVEASKEAAPLP